MRATRHGLLLLAAWACLAAAVEPDLPLCDRAVSREVRQVAQQILLRGYAEGSTSLGAECLLDPRLDRYLQQETAKAEAGGGRWRCRTCGKAFLGEVYLDRHLAARHPALEITHANASCLADLYATLHARLLSGYLAGTPGWASDPAPCRPAAAAGLQAACLALADRCFGAGAGTDGVGSDITSAAGSAWRQRQHDLLARHLCLAHTCDKRRKRVHLQAAAKAHRRHHSSGISLVISAAVGVSLAAFWLLLWLAHTEGGAGSRTYRRLASLRRRLAEAAEAGPLGGMPVALRRLARAGGKAHEL